MANVPYLQLTSTQTQLINASNTPQLIKFDTVEENNDFTVDAPAGTVKVNKDGKYLYIVNLQCGRVGVGQTVIPNIRAYVKKNGVNVANSGVLMNINIERVTKGVLIDQGLITLCKNDILTFEMVSNVNSEARLEAYTATVNEPVIPSCILTVYKLSVESDDGL